MKLGGKFSDEQIKAQQTESLLEFYGQPISLVRKGDAEDDGEGGVLPEEEPVELPEQTLFFGEWAEYIRFQENSGMGLRRTGTYVIVGNLDADLEAGDTFVLNEQEYEVIFLHPEVQHEKLGEVERIGKR